MSTEVLIDKHLKQRKVYLGKLLKAIGDPKYPRKGSTFINKSVLSQAELELLRDIYSCNIKQSNPSQDGITYKIQFE